jgi:hypothetical protein
MNRTLARFALFALACLTSLAHPVAQQGAADPWYGRQAKPQNMDPPKEFTGVFRIELPKNWQLAPGHTGTIFSVVEKTKKWETGGLISLEYQRLQIPLDPPMIAGAVTRQLTEVQNRELSGKQFSGVAKSGSLGPFIFIQYDRPGVSAGDDHVAQYEMPVGTTMYRLICIAPKAQIESYRPMFAHVAASFTLMKPGGPS